MILKRLLFLSLFVSSFAHANLKPLFDQKEINYQTMARYYQDQMLRLSQGQNDAFCLGVKGVYGLLDRIFNEDRILINRLREIDDQDVLEFAQHLEDNSNSDLFAYQAHLERCHGPSFGSREALIQSLNYSVFNIRYLRSSLQLFRLTVNVI